MQSDPGGILQDEIVSSVRILDTRVTRENDEGRAHQKEQLAIILVYLHVRVRTGLKFSHLVQCRGGIGAERDKDGLGTHMTV